jgi:hypothetical protein
MIDAVADIWCSLHPNEILYSGRCLRCMPYITPSDKALNCFNHRFPNCQENIVSCWNCREDHPPKYIETELCENNIVGHNSNTANIMDCGLCGTHHYVGFEVCFDSIQVELPMNLKKQQSMTVMDASVQCNYTDFEKVFILYFKLKIIVIETTVSKK